MLTYYILFDHSGTLT